MVDQGDSAIAAKLSGIGDAAIEQRKNLRSRRGVEHPTAGTHAAAFAITGGVLAVHGLAGGAFGVGEAGKLQRGAFAWRGRR